MGFGSCASLQVNLTSLYPSAKCSPAPWDIWQCLEALLLFLLVVVEGNLYLYLLGIGQDTPKYPTMHKTAPHPRPLKNYPCSIATMLRVRKPGVTL